MERVRRRRRRNRKRKVMEYGAIPAEGFLAVEEEEVHDAIW